MAATAEVRAGPQMAFDFLFRETEAEVEEQIKDWTDEEVQLLQDFVFRRSLKILSYKKTSAKTVREILAWVCAPPESQKHGFSFSSTCAAAGYSADKMRPYLLWKVKKVHGIRVYDDE